MARFTINARVLSDGDKTFTATVCAVPVERSALADVRTHQCESREEARERLDPLAQGLALELSRRGDHVLSIEFA